ncbi:MAG TPA: serine hydrolase [Mycobacteriales bacterium]|nr:serine hydrolase [Mycobacteriales bacterium]
MSGPRTAADLVEWMPGNADRIGLVARCGDIEVSHRADEPFPLAGIRAVLVLGAYAEAVAQRRVDPDEAVPLPRVQAWWIRGTDGGAHMNAERDWRARERIIRGRVLAVPLDEIAGGMVRWSSAACADYLLTRLGADTVTGWARRRGMTAQQPMYPMYGELAGWIRHRAEWPALTGAERAAEIDRLTPASKAVNRWRVMRLGAAVQARCAAVSCAGTPGEWAGLLERVHADSAAGSAAGMAREEAAVLRHHLGWPRRVSERTAERFTAFASASGSFAGVVTEVTHAVGADGRRSVLTQFYRDLPVDTWRAMARTLPHRRLVLDLLTGERPPTDLASALPG